MFLEQMTSFTPLYYSSTTSEKRHRGHNYLYTEFTKVNREKIVLVMQLLTKEGIGKSIPLTAVLSN